METERKRVKESEKELAIMRGKDPVQCKGEYRERKRKERACANELGRYLSPQERHREKMKDRERDTHTRHRERARKSDCDNESERSFSMQERTHREKERKRERERATERL